MVRSSQEQRSKRASPEQKRTTESTLVLPNFLIIGAARSGTTSLFRNLQEHPAIYLPPQKIPEPHFFLKEREYAKGIAYYSNRYFVTWDGQPAIGEVSTSYLCQEKVAARLQRHLPGVMLIAMLRHPVDRAFSSYWHTVKGGLETLSFDEAVRLEDQRKIELKGVWRDIQPYAYIERGFYHGQLSTYLRYFRRDQILVLLFDDFLRRPQDVLSQIFRFLGVDAQFVPDSLRVAENSSTPASAMMSKETRAFLIERFREDTMNLSRLLKRDLSPWME